MHIFFHGLLQGKEVSVTQYRHISLSSAYKYGLFDWSVHFLPCLSIYIVLHRHRWVGTDNSEGLRRTLTSLRHTHPRVRAHRYTAALTEWSLLLATTLLKRNRWLNYSIYLANNRNRRFQSMVGWSVSADRAMKSLSFLCSKSTVEKTLITNCMFSCSLSTWSSANLFVYYVRLSVMLCVFHTKHWHQSRQYLYCWSHFLD